MVRKSGISKKMHVINFKTEKKPKMKFFDFRAFRKKWAKAITWINHLSHAFPGISKYLPYEYDDIFCLFYLTEHKLNLFESFDLEMCYTVNLVLV